jgi:hypothetical protein
VFTDPDTGNVMTASETVTAQLFLRVTRIDGVISRMRGADQSRYPGVDVSDVVYDGYATEPLDPRVRVGTTGTLVFAGNPSVSCEVTELRLPYGKTGVLGSTLNSVLGERIQLLSIGQS